MEETLETRVGYITVSVLRDAVKEYIVENTNDGVYKGNQYYLKLYTQYTKYLEGEK